MKSFFIMSLALVLCISVDGYGQLQRPGNRLLAEFQNRGKDEKIVGYCGCTNCVGRLEHNDPFEDGEAGFFLGGRWTSTVLSGGGLFQGTPTMITWSIVPDGTDANGAGGFVPSNMIAAFDNLFNDPNAGNPDLTTRIWFDLMQQALDRWSEVSGVEYVYEPNDDGSTNFGAGGILGVRGDVRIGGYTIDGGGGILAFNAFPNNGDMAVDTSDTGTFGSGAFNNRLFRNVITHEQGHGLGFFHVESNNAGFLMEPFIQQGFDGPQLDDIRAVHRQYGDFFEKDNNFQGNNSIANATELGAVNVGSSITIGQDGATGTFVSINDMDFVSVDDDGDLDYYEFTLPELTSLTVTLTPVGAAYNQSQEGGAGNNPINPSTTSNLTLSLFNSSGSLLAQVNDQGFGGAEVIEDLLVPPGTYFALATGSANNVQLYTLDIAAEEFIEPNSTPPSLVTLSAGVVATGDVSDLVISNNQYLELNPTVPPNSSMDEIAALFTVVTPDLTPTQLSIDFEASGNSANLEQRLSVFNNFTNQFDLFDSRSVDFSDTAFNTEALASPQSYVSLASGLVLVDLRVNSTGPVFLYPWTFRIDELLVNTVD